MSAESASLWIVFVDFLMGFSGLLVSLLMVTILDSNARKSQLEEERAELDKKAQRAAAREQSIAKKHQAAMDAVAKAEAVKKELATRPIDVVVAVDGTWSMRDRLRELETACQIIAEIGSRLSPRFRLGLVVYRDKEGTRTFGLTEITATVQGQPSAGMLAFEAFRAAKTLEAVKSRGGSGADGSGENFGEPFLVRNMAPLGGPADIAHGLQQGVELLDKSVVDIATTKLLVVVGDMGTFELGSNPDGIDAEDLRAAELVKGLMQSVRIRDPRVRVLTVFTGAGQADLRHAAESRAFFQELADVGGGRFTDDPSQIAATLVAAMLEDQLVGASKP